MKDKLWIVYPALFLTLVVTVYAVMITMSLRSGETVVETYAVSVAR